MISKTSGTNSKKNIRPKIWWIKLSIALILSNIFFFILFSGTEGPTKTLPDGWVELQIRAELLTPHQIGKKILLINRGLQKKFEGRLGERSVENEKLTILVKENEAAQLFLVENWEILPYMSELTFQNKVPNRGENHEIRY